MSLRIFSKVNTPEGIGTLINVVAKFDGLQIYFESTRCVVWFGCDSPGKCKLSGTKWVSREYDYDELLSFNKDLMRNEKIDEIIS